MEVIISDKEKMFNYKVNVNFSNKNSPRKKVLWFVLDNLNKWTFRV